MNLTPRSTPFAVAFTAVLAAATLVASPAWANSNSVVALGIGSRVAYHGPGEETALKQDYGVHLGIRAELLYLFGAELEFSPVPDSIAGDIYRPNLRLTGHLHLLNFETFDFHLAAGMAADTFPDVVDVEGQTTLYRVGAGLEIIPGGHFAIGLDGFFNMAGLGYYNKRLNESLDEDNSVPDPRFLVNQRNIEIGIALRYYL